MLDQPRIINQFYQAELAVERLTNIGVDVVSVSIALSRPVINVAPNRALHQLGGGMHIMRLRNNRREIVNATFFEGCKLQWITTQ